MSCVAQRSQRQPDDAQQALRARAMSTLPRSPQLPTLQAPRDAADEGVQRQLLDSEREQKAMAVRGSDDERR